jgi:hypothetical protein
MKMSDTRIVKLSQNQFAVFHHEEMKILGWEQITEFYQNALGVDIEDMEQILQNLALNEIGSSFEA